MSLFLKEKLKNEKLILSLSRGENFGWGVLSRNLARELNKIMTVEIIDSAAMGTQLYPVFHSLSGEFDCLLQVRGSKNYGYTFFEHPLSVQAIENANNYDLLFCGSTWCQEKAREAGIMNAEVLIQGVDPQLFYPAPLRIDDGNFYIFSGGKFELRKGQDIVLAAIKIIQQKYKNIVLVNAWYNMWPQAWQWMQLSPHIKFSESSTQYDDMIQKLIISNGLDTERIITGSLLQNEKMRDIYAATDVGIFPNRCEGGTNLVLMEYMATGRPVIASFNTGHTDIINEENAMLLSIQKPLNITDSKKKLLAEWFEPSLDELIAKIEYAYGHRDVIQRIGVRAGEEMKKYSWAAAAEQLLVKIFSDY